MKTAEWVESWGRARGARGGSGVVEERHVDGEGEECFVSWGQRA